MGLWRASHAPRRGRGQRGAITRTAATNHTCKADVQCACLQRGLRGLGKPYYNPKTAHRKDLCSAMSRVLGAKQHRQDNPNVALRPHIAKICAVPCLEFLGVKQHRQHVSVLRATTQSHALTVFLGGAGASVAGGKRPRTHCGRSRPGSSMLAWRCAHGTVPVPTVPCECLRKAHLCSTTAILLWRVLVCSNKRLNSSF